MRKIICMVLVLTVLFSLAGCSLGSGGEKVTLKLGLPGGALLTPVEIVDTFKAENPNIVLEIDETPWNEFKRKLKMQISASNPPDVFVMDSGYTATLGGMGAALDLKPRIEKDLDEKDFSKALLAGKDVNGKIWGVPHGLNSTAILYNKDIFDKYGVPYPDENWTYQDMLDIAKKLTIDMDKDGVTDIYGLVHASNISEGWLPFITAAGGRPIDETHTKSLFSDPKTVDGIKKYYGTLKDGISPNKEWIAANGNKSSAFYMGKAAMITAQMSGVKAINDNATGDFKYDVQMLPIGWDGDRHCVYVPNHWIIFSKSPKNVQDAAWEWIKLYLREDSQDLIAKTCPAGFPLRITSLEKVKNFITRPANVEAFYKGIDDHGVSLFEDPTWEEWVTEVSKVFGDLYNSLITADEAAQKCDQILTEILANGSTK